MHMYLVTLKNDDGEIVEQFNQGAQNLRLALDVSAARLGGMASGHGNGAVEATVEILGGYVTDPDTGARVFSTEFSLLSRLAIDPVTREEADLREQRLAAAKAEA